MRESIPAKRCGKGNEMPLINPFFREIRTGAIFLWVAGNVKLVRILLNTERIKWLKKYILSISGPVIHTRTP